MASSNGGSWFDPMSLITSGASGLFGIIGNLFNANQQSKAINAQMKFQQEENDLQRAFAMQQQNVAQDYNATQAQLARQYETDMYLRSLSDNSPQSVLNRLRNAGLNPDLFYGGNYNIDGGMSFSSPSAASSASVPGFSASSSIPSPLDFSGLQNAPLQYAQARLANAQAGNIEEDTKGKAIQNFISELTKGNVVDISGYQVEMSKNYAAASRYEPEIAQQRLDEIVNSVNNMKIEANNLVEQGNVLAAQTGFLSAQTELFNSENILKGIQILADTINLQYLPIEKKLGLAVLSSVAYRNNQAGFKDHALGLLGLDEHKANYLQNVFFDNIIKYDREHNTINNALQDFVFPSLESAFEDLKTFFHGNLYQGTKDLPKNHPVLVAYFLGALLYRGVNEHVDHNIDRLGKLIGIGSRVTDIAK